MGRATSRVALESRCFFSKGTFSRASMGLGQCLKAEAGEREKQQCFKVSAFSNPCFRRDKIHICFFEASRFPCGASGTGVLHVGFFSWGMSTTRERSDAWCYRCVGFLFAFDIKVRGSVRGIAATGRRAVSGVKRQWHSSLETPHLRVDKEATLPAASSSV